MTMHPQAKNKANISSMGVTATLVFSDEAHRESWLRRMEIGGEANSDYARRKGAQDLVYVVGPIGPGTSITMIIAGMEAEGRHAAERPQEEVERLRKGLQEWHDELEPDGHKHDHIFNDCFDCVMANENASQRERLGDLLTPHTESDTNEAPLDAD